MTKNANILLHLSLIPNIGPAAILKIISVLYKAFYESHTHPQIAAPSFDLERLHKYRIQDFQNTFGLSNRVAHLIVEGLQDKTLLEKELALIERYAITVYSFLDPEYPESLKQIHLPPLVIYCKGAPLVQNTKRISIVGSRKADSYAKRCVKLLVPQLVAQDWEIVSGGALGVDSMAHKQTLHAAGKTIAVFGSGLLCPYPKENKELFRAIVQNNGTLVSPFPLKTTPSRGNFPARNRIIAGLCQGCLVVQATEKSGSLITANFALNQGKQVFAIPGQITNELHEGCHELLKQGAKLVAHANDIFEEFDTGLPEAVASRRSLETLALQARPRDERRLDVNGEGGGERRLDVNGEGKKEKLSKSIENNEKEKKKAREEKHPIMKHLSTACSFDELQCITGLAADQLSDQLFTLQLEGKVKQHLSGLWEKI